MNHFAFPVLVKLTVVSTTLCVLGNVNDIEKQVENRRWHHSVSLHCHLLLLAVCLC